MLDTNDTFEQVINLFLAHNIGQFNLLARVKGTWYNVRDLKNVFIKKTACLRDHTAFVIARTKLLLNKINVLYDVALAN